MSHEGRKHVHHTAMNKNVHLQEQRHSTRCVEYQSRNTQHAVLNARMGTHNMLLKARAETNGVLH